MFDFVDPVRAGLVASLRRAWEEIAGPGAWWTPAERVAIATVGRSARAGDRMTRSEALPGAANEAAIVIGGEPARPTKDWVDALTAEMGEQHYVELVGIVGRVVAVDTFTRLLGQDVEPFPAPRPGEPSREGPREPLRKSRTWVSMGAMAAPPFVLAAVPSAVTAMNDLAENMYLTLPEMGDPAFRRGDLHRTQMELVAATVSAWTRFLTPTTDAAVATYRVGSRISQ